MQRLRKPPLPKPPSLLNTPQGAYAKRLAVNLKQLQRSYTNNADHYCTLSTNPYWSYKTVTKNGKKIKVSIKPIKVIGNHKYYKIR